MISIELTGQPVTLPYETRFGGKGYLDCDYIAGITLPGEAPIVHPKLPIGAYTVAIEVSLPLAMGARLAEFYERFYTHKPPHSYDCHSFVGFMQGWDEEVEPHMAAHREYHLAPANPEQLITGHAYAASLYDVILHSLLGVSDPTMSLNVLGRKGDLVYCNTESVMDMYGTSELAEITGYHER